jgi:hypothetical protein
LTRNQQQPTLNTFYSPLSLTHQIRRVKQQPIIQTNSYGSSQDQQQQLASINSYGSVQNQQQPLVPTNSFGSFQQRKLQPLASITSYGSAQDQQQQPLAPTTSYGSFQQRQQPMIASRSLWSSPFSQTGINQQAQGKYFTSKRRKYKICLLASFIPRHPSRSLLRVFQPESTRVVNTKPTSSAYRR